MTVTRLSEEQARALGHTTRREIVRIVDTAAGDVTVAELARALRLTQNAVRKHLALLVRAGLVTEAQEERHARGRPRLVYRPATGANEDPYRRTATLLARVVGRGASPEAVGRAAGAATAGPTADKPVDALAAQLQRDGFDPVVVQRDDGGANVVLRTCPVADAAAEATDVVCRLHLGLIEGMAQAIGGIEISAFQARDPYRAGCRVVTTTQTAPPPLPAPDAASSREAHHMAKQSAALLVYRRTGDGIEVLIVHPGGPYWAKKDDGAWSLPKGEYVDGEDPLTVARREFAEELGQPPPAGDVIDLGEVRQAGGKRVRGFAIEGDVEVTTVVSNEFELEWPPRSGRTQSFPEVDRAMWASMDVARVKLLGGQVPLLDSLVSRAGSG
ncbi:MAG TPA: NUDIX domain-containing protein [Acidimicrobiales bacterium]|nr:NUDIX domain-containing protein [Acidimicrobiales bacterium]